MTNTEKTNLCINILHSYGQLAKTTTNTVEYSYLRMIADDLIQEGVHEFIVGIALARVQSHLGEIT